MFADKIMQMNTDTDSQLNTCEKRTYTVDEIQDILGISQPTAYALVKKNLFKTIYVGRHIRVSKKSFDAWLDNQL